MFCSMWPAGGAVVRAYLGPLAHTPVIAISSSAVLLQPESHTFNVPLLQPLTSSANNNVSVMMMCFRHVNNTKSN